MISKTKIKGDEAEALYQAFMISKGYIVCKNVSDQGCFDFTVTDLDGNTTLIDVKSPARRKNSKQGFRNKRSLTPIQKKLKVKIRTVFLETTTANGKIYNRGDIYEME